VSLSAALKPAQLLRDARAGVDAIIDAAITADPPVTRQTVRVEFAHPVPEARSG
jgi:hypothetical protein